MTCRLDHPDHDGQRTSDDEFDRAHQERPVHVYHEPDDFFDYRQAATQRSIESAKEEDFNIALARDSPHLQHLMYAPQCRFHPIHRLLVDLVRHDSRHPAIRDEPDSLFDAFTSRHDLCLCIVRSSLCRIVGR